MCASLTNDCAPASRGYGCGIREQVIDIAIASGCSLAARTLGITYPTVQKWLAAYHANVAQLEIEMSQAKRH
jgi:transposase-like protein